MKSYIIKSLDMENDSKNIATRLSELCSGKSLLVNLSQNNRFLEIALGYEDYLVYNIYDYIKGVCSLEKSLFEADDDFHLVPSTIKSEAISLDLECLRKDIEVLEENYEFLVIVDSKEGNLVNKEALELEEINIKEKVETEEVKAEAKEDLQDTENLIEVKEDVENVEKKNIFQKILAFFGVKNGK